MEAFAQTWMLDITAHVHLAMKEIAVKEVRHMSYTDPVISTSNRIVWRDIMG